MRERALVAGVAALMFASACAPDPDDPLEAPAPVPVVNAPPPSNPAQTAQTQTPAPAPAPAPVPSSSAPVAAPAVQTPAPIFSPTPAPGAGVQQPTPTPAATPQPSPVAQPSAPVTSPGSPTAGNTSTSGTGVAANVSFNAGSGVLQPDGNTVVYRIPDGTGGDDWNDKAKPIRVKRGMTLRLIDDDKSTAAGGHWLHTYGQPCVHGDSAIGTGFDCVINKNAPMGLNTGVAEHNIFNGIGYLWIEVVAN